MIKHNVFVEFGCFVDFMDGRSQKRLLRIFSYIQRKSFKLPVDSFQSPNKIGSFEYKLSMTGENLNATVLKYKS